MSYQPDTESINKISKIFKDRWNITLKRDSNIYSRTDVAFEKGDKTKEIEIKRRNFKMNQFKTTIINKEKYEYLVEHNAWLLVMFTDYWCIFPKVEDAFVCYKDYYCRSTTDFEEGYYKWSTKAELDISKAKKYYYEQ